MLIEKLNLPTRVEHRLKRAGIFELDQPLEKDRTYLSALSGMGRKSIDEIEKALDKLGLHLKEE